MGDKFGKLQLFAAPGGTETLPIEFHGNPATFSPTVLMESGYRQLQEQQKMIRDAGLNLLERCIRLGSFWPIREALEAGEGTYGRLREFMTPSDFPKLFADTIDRVLIGAYKEYPSEFRSYLKIGKVRDFRKVKRFRVDGADDSLPKVTLQDGYKGSKLDETDWSYVVDKYGRLFGIGWETIINDDLGALRDIPERFGRAARRTENRFAASLWVANATLFTVAQKNKITKALSVAGIQAGMNAFADLKDPQGEPILISKFHLVVPPQLKITANNILNALQILIKEAGGTEGQQIYAQNWMKNDIMLHVEPYIPILDPANGATSWYLFAEPADAAIAEVGFLMGHEAPQVFIKSPNATLIGAGASSAMLGDFENDSVQYKVRHVMGGTGMDWRAGVWSDGTAP